MNSSQNEKCFRQELEIKLKKTRFVSDNVFSENRAVYGVMWKILYSRTGHGRQCGVCALGAGLHKATNTQWGHAVAQLVEALRYKPEGRGFDSRLCHWNF
jgi:hypothetical protein